MKILERIKSHPGSHTSLFKIGRNLLPYYLSRSGFSFPPLTIYVAVDSICNMRCKMCDVGQKNRESLFYQNLKIDGKSEISLERFKKLVDEVSSFKPTISINAAEPLLYPHIREITKYIVDKGLDLQITSNGYLLENFAEDFVKIGLPRLWVSLDGPQEIHNKIRGVDDCWQKATRGLKKIEEVKRKLGKKLPELHTAFTISDYNYHSLLGHLESISDIGFKSFIFAHINFIPPELANVHNQKFEKICKATPMSSSVTDPGKVDLDVLYSQIKEVKSKYGNKAHFLPEMNRKELNTYYRKPEVFVKTKKCQVPWVAVQILANGNLIPLSRCYNMSLGNINESSFMETWNGKGMRKLRKSLQKHGSFPACSRCCGVF